MPNRCVVIGCSNIPHLEKGIALHAIPYWGDSRAIPQERRRKWIEFVQQKRANWEPTKWSVICSKHFKADDFQRRYCSLEGFEKFWIPRLKRDDFGVSVYPSVQENGRLKDTVPGGSNCGASGNRRRRKEVKESFLDDTQPYHQLKNTVLSLRTRLKKRKGHFKQKRQKNQERQAQSEVLEDSTLSSELMARDCNIVEFEVQT